MARRSANVRFTLELVLETFDKGLDSVEPHPFALLVEVKVDVLGSRLVDDEHGVLESLLDRSLVLDLIHQVDQSDVSVGGNLIVQMSFECRGLKDAKRVSGLNRKKKRSISETRCLQSRASP